LSFREVIMFKMNSQYTYQFWRKS